MFDKSNYKIRSYDILPIVREFFKQPAEERNFNNVDEIRRCLSDIKAFSRLSKVLQDQILKEAWYECYAERRVVVRQNDRAACFYIILSGAAIVTYKRLTDDHIQTVDLLERGCTFGEKGLMTNAQQQFTITSKTKLELLVLYKDDFKAIYMTDDRYCSKDDLKFLKTNVPFLRGFPIDRLNEFPHAIQYCNYRQSEVIARDTRRMKHIFVVKKGSMMIWKCLDHDGHIPKLTKHELDLMEDDKIIDDTDNEATQDNKTLFSEIQLSGDVDESSPSYSTIDTDFNIRRSTMINRRRSSVFPIRENSIIDFEKKFPGIADKRDRLELVDYDQLTVTKHPDPQPKRSQSMTNKKSKLILPDRTIYLHIKTLNEGQYFGLTDMLFSNQPALTLISNECECLLLRKSSFVRIASDQYKQNIRRIEIPYPSDEVFYQSYHINEVWKRYSKDVYKDACEKMKQQRPLHTNQN